MVVKVPLRLRGIDLREVGAYNRIAGPDFTELFWMSNGGVSLAIFFANDPDSAVSDAEGWARSIAARLSGITVAEVHDELVSVSDIAARASVVPESVRLWASNKRRNAGSWPFPSPRQVVGTASGGKPMSLYAWREVLSWVRGAIGTDPDEGTDYLSDAQYASLNAAIATIG